MDIAARIGEAGFRKWYERQLIDSHLALTTCFLSGITAAACLEEVSFAAFGWKPASLLAVVFVATALGWYSWRRYITVLERAETYGSHSTCPACKTYGRFEILATGHAAEGPYLDPQAGPLPYPWLRVRCRKCGTVWRMPD
jgi:formate dehydrogenase maturation protein FdhE